MSPEQFLGALRSGKPAPVYLFLGPETYRRNLCRKALIEYALPEELRESGFTRHDLGEITLQEVMDDARSLSLFASDRVIWVSGAEAALPRGRSSSGDEEAGTGDNEPIAQYAADPTPGTVLVFDCQRYELEGEDKARTERVRKFYAAIPAVVEFARLDSAGARTFASQLASSHNLHFAPGALDLLAEATAGDSGRLASEIEKLSLFCGPQGGTVGPEEIRALVPDAAETTIFALVDALAHRDRSDALLLLDRLVREGQYLPLALTFLGGIFRQALIARESNLRSARDIMNHFRGLGIPMWFAKAEQVSTAATRFPKNKLEEGVDLLFRADRDLKGTRPDDRLVLEDFVMRLTAS